MSDNNTATTTKPRSVSRGREAFLSSGRGGAGNIRRSSQDPTPPADPQVPYIIRGRERQPAVSSLERATSSGRGGVGNISHVRSASRGPQAEAIAEEAAAEERAAYERRVIQESEEAAAKGVHSSGRGGLGNIARTKSHSRDPAGRDHSVPATATATSRSSRGGIQEDPSADVREDEGAKHV